VLPASSDDRDDVWGRACSSGDEAAGRQPLPARACASTRAIHTQAGAARCDSRKVLSVVMRRVLGLLAAVGVWFRTSAGPSVTSTQETVQAATCRSVSHLRRGLRRMHLDASIAQDRPRVAHARRRSGGVDLPAAEREEDPVARLDVVNPEQRTRAVEARRAHARGGSSSLRRDVSRVVRRDAPAGTDLYPRKSPTAKQYRLVLQGTRQRKSPATIEESRGLDGRGDWI
jgi:hypothetical protein